MLTLPVIPKDAPPLTREEEAQVQVLQTRLYKECYRGHIPDEQWREFALFCFHYGKQAHQEGFSAGVNWANFGVGDNRKR
jgi:hypothetical protein